MFFFVVHDVFEVIVIALTESGGLEGAERVFADSPFIENVLQMFELITCKSAMI